MTAEPVTPLREAQKLLTRSRLLDAAREVFEERRYAAATIDDIAARAGTSRATVYLHFAGKSDILRELSLSLVADAATYYERLDRVLSEGTRRHLRAWMEDAFGWFERHGRLLPALEEAAMLEPEIAAQSVAALDVLAASMPTYLRAWPADRREEARLRVALLVLQLDGLFRAWSTSSAWHVDRSLAVDVLTDIWTTSLRRPRRA